jgi:hypothetical protein
MRAPKTLWYSSYFPFMFSAFKKAIFSGEINNKIFAIFFLVFMIFAIRNCVGYGNGVRSVKALVDGKGRCCFG